MSKLAVETTFGSLPAYSYVPVGTSVGYTASAAGIGPSMIQNMGTGVNGWIGPITPAVIRPFEYTTSTIVGFPWAMSWSPTLDWVFFSDNLTAAATRRLMYATFNRNTGVFGISGIISITFPVLSAITVRGFGMEYLTITTGSITLVSGSSVVTGSGTQWSTQQACQGNRIGFGSTNPNSIVSWYEITSSSTLFGGPLTNSISRASSSINNNQYLLLTTPSTTNYLPGTPYVIEDLRCNLYTTNTTISASGIFVVKGLRPEIFNATGVGLAAIPSGRDLDNCRASYWLADAVPVTNTASIGHAHDPSLYTFTTHSIWVMDTVANPFLLNYNIRKPLVLGTAVPGRDTGSLILRTGAGGALSGTPSQVDNLILATMGNGTGSGSACLYFTTTTKVYRTQPVSSINSGSTSWLSGGDVMSEIPPGGVNTYAASSVMNTIEYSPLMDKLIIGAASTTTPFRGYITNYYATPTQMDRVWGIDTRQIDQTAADADLVSLPSYTGTNWSVNTNNGISYLGSTNTGAGSAVLTRAYAVPLAADWEYASMSGNRVVSPSISTPNAVKYVRVYVNSLGRLGGDTGKNLGVSTEDFRVYYRTVGISDNSGAWISVDKAGDLSGVSGASAIQFMFEFRTLGLSMVPDKIINVSVLYEDNTTDSHYQPSVAFSDINNKRFAWRFANAWGSTVPTLAINLYDAVSGGTYVSDNTATPTGLWQKSIDNGITWGAYDTNDYANTGSYIRYTPASLGDNLKIKAVLSRQ